VADGLAAPFAGVHTLAHVQAFVDEVVLVDDDSILKALRLMLERAKLVAEPAGAAAYAALLSGAAKVPAGTTVVCVVSGGVCNMGQSAIQAVKNLQHTYGIPFSKIELTPMIGLNDVSSETTSVSDVDTITAYAATNKLAGVHFWSLDRDTPCPGGAQSFASPTCSSINSSTLQFTKRFLSDLGR